MISTQKHDKPENRKYPACVFLSTLESPLPWIDEGMWTSQMNWMEYSNVLLRDRDRGMKNGGWGGASGGLKYPRHTPEVRAYLGSLSKAHRRHVHQMLRQWIDLVRKRGFVDVVYVTARNVLRYLRTAGVHWTFTLGAHWVANLAPELPSRRDAFLNIQTRAGYRSGIGEVSTSRCSLPQRFNLRQDKLNRREITACQPRHRFPPLVKHRLSPEFEMSLKTR